MFKKDWKAFWQHYPAREGNIGLFQQVGKTILGGPIPESQFNCLMDDITRLLKPSPQDTLLDLCCGNGVITNRMAPQVKRTLGIDFSVPLVERARETSTAGNTEYIIDDIRNLSSLHEKYKHYFTMVCCYDALGYLTAGEFAKLLDDLLPITKPGCRMLFGNVLDRSRLSTVYDTSRKKMGYYFSKFTGRGYSLGTWWKMNYIKEIAEQRGLRCTIHEQNKLLYTAFHRKDVLIEKV